MYHCKFRAQSQQGKYVYFRVSDGPMRVREDWFVLAAHPGTPLLRISSVARMMDHLPLCEGDEVLIGGKPYTVNYHKGFNLKGVDGEYMGANLVKDYSLLRQGEVRSPSVVIKYKGHTVPMFNIRGAYQRSLIVAGIYERVIPNKIQVSAGFNMYGSRVFYGDKIDGHRLCMWRGRPCILRDGEYVEMPSGIVIGGRQWNL